MQRMPVWLKVVLFALLVLVAVAVIYFVFMYLLPYIV